MAGSAAELQLQAVLDAAFASAGVVQAALVQRNLLPANLDVRIALVGTGLALAVSLPYMFLRWLLAAEHRSIPRLDVKLTSEEAADSEERKWVRA